MTNSELNLDVKKYETKTSKSGEKIPVVNDVHLHSIYDPKKEANELVKRQSKNWGDKRDILVFGLGFGYHVQALIEELEQRPMSYRIVVIEPNPQTVRDCLQLKNFDPEKAYITTGAKPHEVYNDRKLIDFLLQKPAMFTHPPSFNLYNDYFKSMLSYEAKNDIQSVVEHFITEELKDYFLKIEEQEQSFKHYTANLDKQKSEFTDLDFLVMAYRRLVEKSIKINEGGK